MKTAIANMMTEPKITHDCYGTPIRPNCPCCHGTGYVDSWTCVGCQVAHAEATDDGEEYDMEYDPYFD